MFNPLNLIENSPVVLSTDRVPNMNDYKERKHSFFVETLQFLTEMNADFYEAKRCFYVSVLESSSSTNMTVVHESFGDFFDAVKNIIDKFLAFIKSLFERFVTLINKMIGRDKYIINHKDELKNFSRIHEFTITGFKYSFNDAIPVINAKAAFDTGFVFNAGSDNNSLVLSAGSNNVKSIKGAVTNLSGVLEDGSWYDKFRAEVIGEDGSVIAKDDFADTLFKTYRNDESIAEEITIDNSEVMSALRRFESSKKDIDDVKKKKAKIESEYTSIRKSVEGMVKSNRTNGVVTAKLDDRLGTAVQLSNDEIIAMDNFVKLKVNQLQEMSNIHALAFASKLDALTDCYKQDKAVLFKALGRVQSNKKEV